MKDCSLEIKKLPDIEMYGGDTTPWQILLMQCDSEAYQLPETGQLRCKLTVIPHNASVGNGNKAFIVKPVLTKEAVISASPSGAGVSALFTFQINDTIALKGKFIYQIEITNDVELYVNQGHLLIRQNCNV